MLVCLCDLLAEVSFFGLPAADLALRGRGGEHTAIEAMLVPEILLPLLPHRVTSPPLIPFARPSPTPTSLDVETLPILFASLLSMVAHSSVSFETPATGKASPFSAKYGRFPRKKVVFIAGVVGEPSQAFPLIGILARRRLPPGSTQTQGAPGERSTPSPALPPIGLLHTPPPPAPSPLHPLVLESPPPVEMSSGAPLFRSAGWSGILPVHLNLPFR